MVLTDWTGGDWAANMTALSLLLGSVGTLYQKMRNVGKKVEETHELANGNLSKANARIEQLTALLSENGIPVPESDKKEDDE